MGATQTQRAWTREQVVAVLDNHPVGVERAVLALYARQTSGEREAQTTRELNGAGFNAYDAGYLSYLAEYMERTRRGLDEPHRSRARKRLTKYVGQLVRIANGEA